MLETVKLKREEMTERLRTDGQIYSPRVWWSCNDLYFIVTVLSVMDSILWGRSCIYGFCYETIKREFKKKPITECRWDERLKTKTEESTRLSDTGFLGELEHLKVKTRLIDEKFVSVMYMFLLRELHS
jgi:hypothetical protein